jgi:transposase-like protein
MRRDLPADDKVTVVMERVLAQAAENGRRATVTAVERALGIPQATFDRNYRHLTDDFRRRAQQQAGAARPAGPVGAGNDPGQVMQRLRRENEDLRRLVKIYGEAIRQLTLDHLELEAKLNTAAGVTTLADRKRNR